MNGFVNGLLDEQPYSLTVNGRNLASVMMLSGNEREFAVGYLTTEGITPFSEIESVMLDSNTISVLTVNPMKVLLPKKAVISGCGGTASYLESSRMPKITNPAVYQFENPELNNEIVRAGGYSAVLITCEGAADLISDINQTAAVNKAVGLALYKKIPLEECVLGVSGKVTADIVRMCRFAQISKIVSLLPPTALAKSVADDGGVKILTA
ncbi:MAG: formate dehydrogenase accessory sulfurtransferase FdhD [Methanocorpusculum sp.]|nr:formate dehydrogenase accessory sulfurtransferase FdhD [Methanocorpusculum sp.]